MEEVYSFVLGRGRNDHSWNSSDIIIATWPRLHVRNDDYRSECWGGGVVECGDFIRGCKYVYENPKDP